MLEEWNLQLQMAYLTLSLGLKFWIQQSAQTLQLATFDCRFPPCWILRVSKGS